MACLYEKNRVVIHDLETGEQKEIEIKGPSNCASSQYFLAVATNEDGLHLFSTDGILVHIVPDSINARSAAFHPHNTDILAFGDKTGSVHTWNASTQAYVSSFKEHTYGITNIRWESDCRMFLSSYDHTASIVTLDDRFQLMSAVKLKGHAYWVTDILPLPTSNKCVTCSADQKIKVWDCETGACLRTLTEHTDMVTSLAMHSSGQYFAGGSYDESVIFWSCKTFEVLRRVQFLSWVYSVVFGEADLLWASVRDRGVMSCDALTGTGEAGPVIIPETSRIQSLAFGKKFILRLKSSLFLTWPLTVHAPKPWTPSIHAQWPMSSQRKVYLAVAVLWKVRDQGRLMQMPYELVDIVLRHVR